MNKGFKWVILGKYRLLQNGRVGVARVGKEQNLAQKEKGGKKII